MFIAGLLVSQGGVHTPNPGGRSALLAAPWSPCSDTGLYRARQNRLCRLLCITSKISKHGEIATFALFDRDHQNY